MQTLKTTKLFYDQYMYRLVVQHNLGIIFRDKNLSYARSILDSLQQQAETGDEINWKRSLRYTMPVTRDALVTAQFLLAEFTAQGHDNYKLRCEHPFLNIYTNDIHWVESLKNRNLSIESFTQPSIEDINNLKPKVIITNENPIEFQYKVTVGNQVSSGLGDWITANPDKCKAGNKFLQEVKNNGYVNGMYFYVRDEKVLQLIQIIIGGNIKRVDKFINSALS